MSAISSFIKAPACFVKALGSFISATACFVKAPDSFIKALGSFINATSNFIPAGNNFERDVACFILYLLIFKLYPAYLLVLGACCAENGLNIYFYVNSCINQTDCSGIKKFQGKNIGVLSLTPNPSPHGEGGSEDYQFNLPENLLRYHSPPSEGLGEVYAAVGRLTNSFEMFLIVGQRPTKAEAIK